MKGGGWTLVHKKMTTPFIVQVCIASHVNSVCTWTLQIVRVQFDVSYSHAGYFTWILSHGWFLLSWENDNAKCKSCCDLYYSVYWLCRPRCLSDLFEWLRFCQMCRSCILGTGNLLQSWPWKWKSESCECSCSSHGALNFQTSSKCGKWVLNKAFIERCLDGMGENTHNWTSGRNRQCKSMSYSL